MPPSGVAWCDGRVSMHAIVRCKERLDKAFLLISTVCFIITSFCVLVQIVARYTPFFSAAWTDEMTRLFFMYTMMSASPLAIKCHEYAVIDLIPEKLHGTASMVFAVTTHVVIVLVSGVAAAMSVPLFQASLTNLSTALRINMGFYNIVPLVLFTLTCIYALIEIFMIATGRSNPKREGV